MQIEKGFCQENYTRIINLMSLANKAVTRMLVCSFMLESGDDFVW